VSRRVGLGTIGSRRSPAKSGQSGWPDWDNCGKITDALNGTCWVDDGQIVDGRVIKLYATIPRLVIEVREVIEVDQLNDGTDDSLTEVMRESHVVDE